MAQIRDDNSQNNEYHSDALSHLCRVCGNRVLLRKVKDKQGNVTCLCKKYAYELLLYLKVDISKDNTDIHPTHFCRSCYFVMKNVEKSKLSIEKKTQYQYSASQMDAKWIPHQSNFCFICEKYEDQKKGVFGKRRHQQKQTISFETPEKKIAEMSIQTTPRMERNCVRKVLTVEENKPLDKFQEEMATSLTKSKIKSSRGPLMRFTTKGREFYTTYAAQPRVPTTKASPSVINRRVRSISAYRRAIAGEDDDSISTIHGAEIKALPSRTKDTVLQKGGIKSNRMSTKYALAMKSRWGTPWNQRRELSKFLKSFGFQLPSERKVRSEQDKIIGNQLTASKVTMEHKLEKHSRSIKGKITKDTPLIYTKDLCAFVKDLLEKYDETNKLDWQSGIIPSDEIWLKLGGDHGGDHFKLCLQIANVQNPNSKNNTFVIAMFQAKDSHVNLETMFDILRDDLDALKHMRWKDKFIRMFLFGDYEFMSKMYGMSGARGVHFCLWCDISSKEAKLPLEERGPSTRRKLSDLKHQYRQFRTTHKGKLTNASKCLNVIHQPLFNIPVRQVCPPYLHILLGIVKRHHDLLEEECHNLDLELANHLAKSGSKTGENTFDDYITAIMIVQSLEATLQNENDEAVKQDLAQKLDNKKKNLNLEQRSGPVAGSLEQFLSVVHKISIHAYHSRSMNGNHCTKYIDFPVYASLCESVRLKTQMYTGNSSLLTKADTIGNRFNKLNLLFSKIHVLVAHSFPISDQQHEDISTAIKQYMAFYRAHYPKKLIPKHHFLEDHLLQWIERWHFGMGLHGEQGGESIHAEFNKIFSTMSGIRDPLQKYVSAMKEHYTRNSPLLRDLIPSV